MKPRTPSIQSEVQLAVLETRLTTQDTALLNLTGICAQTLDQAKTTNGRVNVHDVLIKSLSDQQGQFAKDTAEHRESVVSDLNEIKAWMKGVPMVGGALLLIGGLFAWAHEVGLIKF